MIVILMTALPQENSSSPQVLWIDFPGQILADGSSYDGYLGFQDADGDIVQVKFELIEGDRSALQLEPGWEFNPNIKGQTEGVIAFHISASAPQQVTLQVTLHDEAGNQSEPYQLSFAALAVAQPDLVVSLGELPSSVRTGESLKVKVTMSNQGEADAGSFRIGVYLSQDKLIAPEDLLLTSREVEVLQAGSSSTKVIEATIPQDLFSRGFSPGELFLGALVDDLGQVEESDEEDNVDVKKIEVLPPLPVADFSASPTSGPVPLTVAFTDHSRGWITQYFWEFGDGDTSTAKDPEHTYDAPGTYTVRLTVRGPGGESTKMKRDLIHGQRPALFRITDVSIEPKHPFIGDEVSIEVTIENSGEVGGSEEVRLYINDILATAQHLSLDPGSRKDVASRHIFPAPGRYELELKTNDDSRVFTLEVVERPTVCPRARGCAYASIQQAIEESGLSTITIAPGTYRENLVITDSLALQGISWDEEKVVIRVLQKGKPAILIENTEGEITVKLTNLTITSGSGEGLKVLEKVELSIEGCSFLGNGGDGISIGNHPQVLIRGSEISNNGGNGIFVWGVAQVTIEANVIRGNGSSGIDLGVWARAEIEGNTIEGNNSYGITAGSDRSIVSCRGNDVSENQAGDYDYFAARACH